MPFAYNTLEDMAVHPHVRGDDVIQEFHLASHDGSPPRAWGRCFGRINPLSQLRFTPTCVGTMTLMTRKLIDAAVHPHVRGDDTASPSGEMAYHGSPPRAWGRWRLRELATAGIRFTPTCVGTMRDEGFV